MRLLLITYPFLSSLTSFSFSCHLVGGVIMLLGFLLFESQFIHVVSITFTALVLTELLMVALTIRTWHGLMLLAELFSVVVYMSSLAILRDYFGKKSRQTESNFCVYRSRSSTYI